MILIDDLEYGGRSQRLIDELKRQVLVLDGAMGTMIQQYRLAEDDFRGSRFKDWDYALKGCNDILALTAPDKIKSIHRQYLEAGAAIIETNSFNANAISLADYNLSGYVHEINVAAARVAREVVDEFMLKNSCRQCWVAGSVGPTGKSLVMSQGIDADDNRTTWDEMVATYIDQMSALLEGGVDALLIETIFDGLNAKAAVYAARRAMEQVGIRVPLMLSLTLTESSRTLSGQTLEAFVASVLHAEPMSIGLNCGFGADGMLRHIEALQHYGVAVSVYPNAGLPNEMGCYEETPETMAMKLRPMLQRQLLNIVGGCCGTTPEHIAAIAKMAAGFSPRAIPKAGNTLLLAGLEPLEVSANRNFLNIGERCNVAGSRKFLRLVKEGNIDEAIDIARRQVEAGAQAIDINMDDAMLDAVKEMTAFLCRVCVEPDVAKVPVMIDSSNWDVIIAGLTHVQGRPIVNSISLKEGEEIFLEKARYIREMGAAMVVMAFDEMGQADTFERKITICERAYRLLIEKVHFPSQDIIFDPNVLAVATGIEEHNNYALDFINAVKWIKQNLPMAKVSGGISNLSFALRGNNYVREAMHAMFLYHACAVGLDMAIVNAATLMTVDDMPEELHNAIDDVLFNKDANATERLIAIAGCIKSEKAGVQSMTDNSAVEHLTPAEQIAQMLVKGLTEGMEKYLTAAMTESGSAMAVIDGALMSGMNKVGELFGAGKMFLPQVVKSARAMKYAVSWLSPYIEQEKQTDKKSSSGKIVIATVKGDVHDIGKNIVDVIMNCNGFDMIDMGVMVPGEDIVTKAIAEKADFIGLSGLITPSLEEMCHVAKLMEINGMRIPLLIGGATTSALHTAVKIAPCYGGPVVYTRDATMLPAIAQKLVNEKTRHTAVEEIREAQEKLRQNHKKVPATLLTLEQARAKRLDYGQEIVIPAPKQPGIHDIAIPVSDARGFINWRAFFSAWKMDASFASITEINGCDHCRAQWLASMTKEQMPKAVEAMQLWKEACNALDFIEKVLDGSGLLARVALLPAGSRGDDIMYGHDGKTYLLPTLRRQDANAEDYPALADYIKPIVGDNGPLEDWIGMFAVTSTMTLQRIIDRYKKSGDDYKVILYQSLADRLVEAATEIVHRHVRRELWGYAIDEDDNPHNLLRQYYKGIRPAIGYPSLPDQSLVFLADKVLHYSELEISLTEHGAMIPSASTTGYIFAHPDSKYFMLGAISDEQRTDYARRRNMSLEEISPYLP